MKFQDDNSKGAACFPETSEPHDAPFQGVIERLTDGFVCIDARWCITYINPAGSRLLNRAKDRLVGRRFFDAFPDAMGTLFEKHFAAAMESGETDCFESFYPPLQIWLECRCYAAPDGISVLFKDTTEKRLEDQEREGQLERMEKTIAELEGVINAMTEGMCIFDVHGRLIKSNRAALMLHGFTRSGQMCRHLREYLEWFEFRDLSDRPLSARQWPISRIFDGESFSGMQVKLIRKDTGAQRVLSYGGAPAYGKDGRPLLAILTMQDLTREKQVQKELRQARSEMEKRVNERTAQLEAARKDLQQERDWLTALLDSMVEEVWFSDAEGNITLVNQAALNTLQVSEDQACGHVSDIEARLQPYTADGRTRLLDDNPLLRALTGQTIEDEEIVWDVETGKLRYRQYNAVPVKNKTGTITGSVIVVRDITEKKAMEMELQNQNEILQKIFDHIPVILVFYDKGGNVFLVNREFERVIGWRLDELQQMDIMAACYPDPQYRRKVWDFMISGGIGWRDFTLRCRSGKSIDTSWAHVRLSDGSQIGIGIDISQRKIAEEKLRVSQARLKELSRKTLEILENDRQAVANELHDSVGASLAAIKFSLEDRVGKLTSGQQTDRPDFCNLIGHLRNTIKESKRISARLRPMMLDDLGLLSTIEWYTRSFRESYPEMTLQKDIEINENEIPDPLKIVIYRVIQEALNNAAKHSQGDTVYMQLARVAEGIRLVVKDNGAGFDARQLTESRMGPSGYGLQSMQERIEICGGQFWFSSHPDSGTVIQATLPVQEGELHC